MRYFIPRDRSGFIKKNWYEAQKHCEAAGGDLTSVNDQQEKSDVVALIERAGLDEWVWIGGTDKVTEGEFVWSDGSSFNFTDWNTGEPNNHYDHETAENCLSIREKKYRRKWNDAPCHLEMPFVCKVTL